MYVINNFTELAGKKIIYTHPQGHITESLIIVTEDKGVLQACCCDYDTKKCVSMHDENLSKLVIQGLIFQDTSWHLCSENIITLEEHHAYMSEYQSLEKEWLESNKDKITKIQTSWYCGYRRIK